MKFTFSGEEAVGIADEVENKLLKDIFELSTQPINNWYPEHEIAKKDPIKLGKLDKKSFPAFQQFYSYAVSQTNKMFKEHGHGKKPNQSDFKFTYLLLCRGEVNVLE